MATVTPKPLVEGTLLAAVVGILYTVPLATTAVVRSITFCNTDSVDRTVTLHIVPSGGAVGAANRVYSAMTIEPNQTVESDALRVLLAGGTIQALADAGNVVSMRVDGSELT